MRDLDSGREAWRVRTVLNGNNAWAVGGHYSIADIHLFRLFWRFHSSLNFAPGDFPSIERLYERMMARPAVKKTIELESRVGYELPA